MSVMHESTAESRTWRPHLHQNNWSTTQKKADTKYALPALPTQAAACTVRVETRTSTTADRLYKGRPAHGNEQRKIYCISVVIHSTYIAKHVGVSQSSWQRRGRYTESVTDADRCCRRHSGQYTSVNPAGTA